MVEPALRSPPHSVGPAINSAAFKNVSKRAARASWSDSDSDSDAFRAPLTQAELVGVNRRLGLPHHTTDVCVPVAVPSAPAETSELRTSSSLKARLWGERAQDARLYRSASTCRRRSGSWASSAG